MVKCIELLSTQKGIDLLFAAAAGYSNERKISNSNFIRVFLTKLGESINQSTVKCYQINQVKLTVGLMNYS